MSLLRRLFGPRPEPPPKPEHVPDEYERFWRDHVLLWVGVWPEDWDNPSLTAIDAVERTLRAMPEFHDMTIVGTPESPRFDVWLRRDTPGDDDMIYMDRAAGALKPFDDSDEIGYSIEFGDY
ncbi:hypothetical protein DVA67_004515 [Solirubrobacter sp. CPCC 204708]|uniref:Uncharacterized protein n=1 Tax=Solirubrobacter deserti TaxID=2282478 RepID=A0ABT4RHF8_9ACTN|nr:hypothetical protein [Solirubrobacter deserti]MBE2315224.1 hypothetical protein [Solirubrobacter deserti]MDA0137908.1 hypothetical protein [Solirubrobacter deserti]